MTQEHVAAYLRHGQIPFFRLPLLDTARADGPEHDAVVLGIPYDGGVTYQAGARLGPYHVRQVSALVSSYHPTHGVDVFSRLRVSDGGNIPIPPFNAKAMRDLIEQGIDAILGTGAAPFVVGGDHSITLPCLRAVTKRHGPVAVIHIDAHFDTSDGEMWGEPFHHGTPIRHALHEGLIAPHGLVQLGVRGPWKGVDEDALSREHGAFIRTADELAAGMPRLMKEVAATVGNRPVYLTFDVDAIDPAFAPGTGTPVPGGLTTREALHLMRGLAGIHLVGMDVVEVSPPLDNGNVTSLLAAHLLFEGLALMAVRRQPH